MINLVFPPGASPTHVPLGISCLKSYIDKKCGSGLILPEDLNIRYWEYLCETSADYEDYRRFVQGKTGLFSREYYEALQPVSRALKGESSLRFDSLGKYLDTNVLPASLEKLFLYLVSFLSETTSTVMFSCLFPDQLLFALGFSRWLAESRGCRIYIGGASSLLTNPTELLSAAPWVTGVFTGEGEASLEVFLLGGEEAVIPGLYRRQNGQILPDAPPAAVPMEDLPPPDFSWARMASYFNPVPFLPVQLSRGCKWRRCRFCAHNFSFGRYRCMDPVGAVDMLENYRNTLGAGHFYFTDQYLDASFLEPFAREVLARSLDIHYTFMGRPAEDMTPEVLALLARSGCVWISWGVESGSARLLDGAAKGTRPEVVSRVLKGASEAGINNLALMIFGLPGSDEQALEETFSFLQENRPWIDAHTASEFQLYRGTPFGNDPEKYGMRVTHSNVFCRIDGKPLESVKLGYVDLPRGEESAEILLGPLEARRWKRRKTWIYPDTFWDSLPSEHYLILASRNRGQEKPDNPEYRDIAG